MELTPLRGHAPYTGQSRDVDVAAGVQRSQVDPAP